MGPFHCSIGVSCYGNQLVKLLWVREDGGVSEVHFDLLVFVNHNVSCFIERILLLKLHVLILDHYLVCCTGKFIGFLSNLFLTQV